MGTHVKHEFRDIYQSPRRTPVTEDSLMHQRDMKDIRRAATRERRKYHLHYFLTRGWHFLAGLVVLAGIWATLIYIMRALTEHP